MERAEELGLREAGAADWEGVADLQIASWRSAYRGILSDDYLDGPVVAERRAVWRERLAGGPKPDQVVVIGEDAAGPVAGTDSTGAASDGQPPANDGPATDGEGDGSPADA